MIKCPFCGKKNPDDAIICSSCDEVIVEMTDECADCKITYTSDGVWQPGADALGEMFGG